ncbi:MAG: hypothetical protein NTY87_07890 [Planctomycetia bacterium]|nr:hypothetical protein [Planctomycetia bacterium]
MKRFLGFAVAMFFALVAIALLGGDSGAVAGQVVAAKLPAAPVVVAVAMP